MRLSVLSVALLTACTAADPDLTPDGVDPVLDVPDGDTPAAYTPYAFVSRFDGEPSASTSGQAFRQVLIHDLNTWLGRLPDQLVGGWFPGPRDVEGGLLFYTSFDSDTSGGLPHLFEVDPAPVQSTYDDIAANKDLFGKIAGNDPVGQHVDWIADGVIGVTPGLSPEEVVRAWIAEIDDASVAWADGDIAVDPHGNLVPAPYVTADGLDLRQLVEKFLRGAVSLSQGTDDYLDDTIDGKGLLSDHSVAEEGANYTALEHAWDEGFGYYGASTHNPMRTAAEVAAAGHFDENGDGLTDLVAEVNHGHSTNSAKRDAGAVVATDFSERAWEGFVGGRQLLADTEGSLTAGEMSQLLAYRDMAVGAWEEAIGATIVHYVNEVLIDMEGFGTDDYDFGAHAKHWSELKGFALAPQFNPRSPLTLADLTTLHDLIGVSPVLADADAGRIADYMADLRTARAIIGDAYGFDEANLGDDRGQNGW